MEKSTQTNNMNTGETAVFILAAGEGSRLRPLTNYIPKPLLPVSLGRKMISFILDACTKENLDTYILVRENKKEYFQKFIDKNKSNVKILSSDKELETGGEIFNHINTLEISRYTYLAIVPSDYYINNLHLRDAVKHMSEESLDVCILGCKIESGGEYLHLNTHGLVSHISSEISDISAKGIYIVRTEVLKLNKDLAVKKLTTTEFLNYLISKNYRVGFSLFEENFLDLGTWSSYISFLLKFNTVRFFGIKL